MKKSQYLLSEEAQAAKMMSNVSGKSPKKFEKHDTATRHSHMQWRRLDEEIFLIRRADFMQLNSPVEAAELTLSSLKEKSLQTTLGIDPFHLLPGAVHCGA
ncbi:hypothetical protein CDAR_282821 [Caerostris darwini]|uniref:Uncharacterized protein n=1 Tax=Caerostris darwini TaxID=1538125 RepID=A0AAV4W5T8_9ARAC|nr:hypothetical protein CDAR_282821 [Caerostris darwini]